MFLSRDVVVTVFFIFSLKIFETVFLYGHHFICLQRQQLRS